MRTILSGRVSVDIGGAAAPLSRQTQRLVVALAASRGLPVPTDTLVERLWDEPPSRPEPTLRVVVSRAREQLGSDDLIETGPIGRRWAGPADEVDLWSFEARAGLALKHGTADPDEIEELLGTWRGEPFGPFGRLPFLVPLTSHLEELHRSLQELWLRSLLHGGSASQAVLVAEAMVESEPLRENRWAALMVALYRDGRQTDALRAFQRARTTLLDAAGVEPGRDLVTLERRILERDDSLLDGPRPTPGRARARTTTLVGRRAERQRLVDEGRHRICLLGEPGIGKTTLLNDAADTFAHRGRTVVVVAAPRSPARPAMVIARLLELLAAHHGVPDDPVLRAALATVAPELVEGPDGAADRTTVVLERPELVLRIAHHLVELLTRTDTVIVLDDCQWMDRLSSDIFRQVCEADAGTLLFATQPIVEPHLGWVLEGGLVQVVELGGLDDAAARELLELKGLASHVVSQAEELRDRSGGNPLLLSLLGEAAGTGIGSTGPSDVRDAVDGRLNLLSRRALETLQVASVLGRRFSLEHLLALRPTASTDLIEARDARLVEPAQEEHGDLPQPYVFVHGLVAEVVGAQLAEGRRVDVCDDIGRLFEDLGRPAIASAPYLLAAAPLDRLRAARACLRAGDEYRAAFAYDEALPWYESGLAVLDTAMVSHAVLRAELLVRTGAIMRRIGRRSAGERLLDAIDACRVLELHELFAFAVHELCSHGTTTTAGRTDRVTLALLDEALALPISERTATQLCGVAATLLTLSANSPRGRELFISASRRARELGDPDLEAQVLLNLHLGLSDPDDLAMRLDATRRLRELVGDHVERAWEVAFLDFVHAIVGADRAAMDHSIETMRRLTPLVVERPRSFGMTFCEAAHAHATGDVQGAKALLDQVLAIGLASFDTSWAIAVYSSLLLCISIDDGTVASLSAQLDAMIGDQPEIVAWRCAAAMVAVETGDLERARRELDWALRDDLTHLVRDQTWTPAMVCLTKAAVALCDRDAAATLVRALEPYRGRMTWAGTCTYGPVDLSLSLLHEVLGNHQLAAEHLAASNAMATRLGCLQYVH